MLFWISKESLYAPADMNVLLWWSDFICTQEYTLEIWTSLFRWNNGSWTCILWFCWCDSYFVVGRVSGRNDLSNGLLTWLTGELKKAYWLVFRVKVTRHPQLLMSPLWWPHTDSRIQPPLISIHYNSPMWPCSTFQRILRPFCVVNIIMDIGVACTRGHCAFSSDHIIIIVQHLVHYFWTASNMHHLFGTEFLSYSVVR